MEAAEALTICRMVKSVCPSQAIDEYTPNAWAALLDDVRFDDARQAVIELGKLDLEPGKSRYIEPGHIRKQVKDIRGRRIDSFDMSQVSPPPGLDGSQYIGWLRDVRERIGDGASLAELDPPAVTRAALTADERAAIRPTSRKVTPDENH